MNDYFQMPDWMSGATTMNYQPPQMVSSAVNNSNTSPYIYRQAFGGYGVNTPGDLATATPNYAQSLQQGNSWSNMSPLDKMSTIGTGIQAFATLAGLYSGWKGLQYQKDQFKFMKSSWNKNFAAQLGAYDNALRDNYRKMAQGAAHFGNPVPTEEEYMNQRSLSYLGT